jgi:hypothetical protein
MQHTTVSPRSRSRWIKLLFLVLLAGIVGLAIWTLPRGYSTDLSRIGQGGNVVVQVHDHGLVSSTTLMESLNKVRHDYEGVIEFVVADLQIPAGRAFAQTHNAEAATLLLFAPDGTRLGVVQGAHEPVVLRQILDQVYRPSAPQ